MNVVLNDAYLSNARHECCVRVTRIESRAHICVFEPPTLLTQRTLQPSIAAYTAKGERTWFNIPETETDACARTE